MKILAVFVEILAALFSTLNRVAINKNPDSILGWWFLFVTCLLSALLAELKVMNILFWFEVFFSFLTFTLIVLRTKKASETTQKQVQVVTTIITVVVCTVLFTRLKEKGPKEIAEFFSVVFFAFGIVLQITNNRFGHLLFALGNLSFCGLALVKGMYFFSIQQFFSFFLVICTFLGYRFEFCVWPMRFVKITKNKE